MKCLLSSFMLILSLLGVMAPTPANATGSVTQSEWTLIYPDFSKLVTDQEWVFEVRANGANEIGASDFVDLDIFTSSNVMVAFKSYVHTGPSVKQVKLSLILDKDALTKANIDQPLSLIHI